MFNFWTKKPADRAKHSQSGAGGQEFGSAANKSTLDSQRQIGIDKVRYAVSAMVANPPFAAPEYFVEAQRTINDAGVSLRGCQNWVAATGERDFHLLLHLLQCYVARAKFLFDGGTLEGKNLVQEIPAVSAAYGLVELSPQVVGKAAFIAGVQLDPSKEASAMGLGPVPARTTALMGLLWSACVHPKVPPRKWDAPR